MKMLKRSPGIVLIALLLILVMPASAAAQEVPQLPASYRGTVRIYDGAGEVDAPSGTIVTAWVDGVERGSIVVTEPGKYGGPAPYPNLYVGGEADKPYILQDSLIEFYVDGSKADQTASFQSGYVGELNLTAFIPTTVLLGDANGDGKINAADITKVERIIVDLDPETPGADACEDGVIDASDITTVEMIIAGLD